VGSVGSTLGGALTATKNGVRSAITSTGGSLGSAFTAAKEKIESVARSVGSAVRTAATMTKDAAQSVVGSARNVGATAGNWVTTSAHNVASAANVATDRAENAVHGAFSVVQKKARSAKGKMISAKDRVASAARSATKTAAGTARAVGARVHGAGKRIKGIGEGGVSVMQRGWNAVHSAGQALGAAVGSGMHRVADTMKQAKMPEVGHSLIQRTKDAAVTGMQKVSKNVTGVKEWFTHKLSEGAAALSTLKDDVVGGANNLVDRVRGVSSKKAPERPAYITRRDTRQGMKRMKRLVRVRSAKDLYAAANGPLHGDVVA
jgi:phage-related protein